MVRLCAHRRRRGVERDHVRRSGRAVARRIGEQGRDRLGAVGPEVAGRHRKADAAGRDVGRRNGVRHLMRQRRTAQQQLDRIASRNRRIERHRERRAVTSVMLSLCELPESEAAVRAGVPPVGAMVSTVT